MQVIGNRGRKRGFTLLEIIVVAAIVAMVVLVTWRIYTTGTGFFEAQKKKAEILHDVRRVLLFFDRDLREAQVGISGRVFNISTDRIEFERLTSSYQSNSLEKVAYHFLRSGESVTLVRTPAVFKSTGRTVLMETRESTNTSGAVLRVGLVNNAMIGERAVRTEFRGYTKDYDPFFADALPNEGEKEAYRMKYITYVPQKVYFVEARMVVRDRNNIVNMFTTRICPRTRMRTD